MFVGEAIPVFTDKYVGLLRYIQCQFINQNMIIRTGENGKRKVIASACKILPGKKQALSGTTTEVIAGVKNKSPDSDLAVKKILHGRRSTALLKLYWPELFDGESLRPVVPEIREQLLNDVQIFQLPLSARLINQCLKELMRSEAYLQTIRIGALRYDSMGTPCAAVG